MQLALDSISKRVGAQTWLHGMSMALHSGAVTVLLGATQAGKTSLSPPTPMHSPIVSPGLPFTDTVTGRPELAIGGVIVKLAPGS